MSYEKFKPDDLFINRAKTHPQFDFFVYNTEIYINNHLNLSGAFSNNVVVHGSSGSISLYEMNIDRTGSLIYPFIIYNGSKQVFKKSVKHPNVKISSQVGFSHNYATPQFGDTLVGSYPMSASISRKLTLTTNLDTTGDGATNININVTASALQNTALKYASLSKHFIFHPTGSDSAYSLFHSGSGAGDHGTGAKQKFLTRNLLKSTINFIFVPSIFYGSSIKKGSVSLKYYYTGSLIGELVDKNRNGELIQVSGANSANDGIVCGVVLYDEGIMMLTASHAIASDSNIKYEGLALSAASSWTKFGNTMNDGVARSDTLASASYNISFKGTNYVNTMTMMCHAKSGHLNYSNNPTYLDMKTANQKKILTPESTGSYTYVESIVPLKNVVSSSFMSASEGFQKTTYLSKIGIYDKAGNLLMVANMAKPVKKTENRDLTFKLKLDI